MAREKKQKKIKPIKYRSEEIEEIRRFIILLVVVILLIVAVYFITRIFVTKDLLNSDDTESEIVEGSINYSITLIGNMLNKPDDEYYVVIYNAEDLRAVYYSSLMSNYLRNEEPLALYYVDLSNILNAKFYDPDNITTDIESISDLRVGDLTLIKVEDNEIAEIITDEEEIAQALAYIEEEDTD